MCFVVYAEPLVSTLYTERYADAADAARLLVVGQGLHFFTLLAFTTLVAVGRNRLYPIAMLLGVVVNIVLNLILIPELLVRGFGVGDGRDRGHRVVDPRVRRAPHPGHPAVAVGGDGRSASSRPRSRSSSAGVCSRRCRGRSAALVMGADLPRPSCTCMRPDGPGGLRALAGSPRDDLAPADGGAVTTDAVDADVETGPERPER